MIITHKFVKLKRLHIDICAPDPQSEKTGVLLEMLFSVYDLSKHNTRF